MASASPPATPSPSRCGCPGRDVPGGGRRGAVSGCGKGSAFARWSGLGGTWHSGARRGKDHVAETIS